MHKGLVTVLSGFVLAGTITASSGCYGSFQMTRDLHEWNGQVTDNKFINWLLFVGLFIVPVYEVSVLVDGFVLNSLEFWTGDNPVASDRMALSQNEDGTIEAKVDGRTLTLRPGPKGSIEILENGEPAGRAVRHKNGGITLYDAGGDELRHISAETVEDRRAAMAR